MKRFRVRGKAVRASFQISHAVACLSLAWISTQAAHADLSAGAYNPNWVRPTQERIFTAADSTVRAKLTVKRNIFDQGNAKTSGKLTIMRNGILAGSDSYVILA